MSSVMSNLIFRSFLRIVCLALFLIPSVALCADKWVEVRSAHFTISSNAGEKEARRIANQFEEIRGVFLAAFPSLKVDAGKPLVLIAVKNEDSLKVLLPDFWNNKDRTPLAGIFVPGFDRNFALLRTDVQGTGENPYHSLYHEYTHAIMRLNFATLPTWLDEGLAEFYGNTLVESGEIGIGQISKRQLALLQRSQLIPIQTLMSVDHRSPLYNERAQVSIFYAESWALVHYLMTDPEARKEQTLKRFMEVLEKTNDSEEAAKESFGDLKKFQITLESYARQVSFHYMKMKPQAPISDKDYAARELSPAEVLTVQADFLEHNGHGKEARSLLQQAIEQQPGLAAAYSERGFYEFYQHDNDGADKDFDKAIELDPKDYRAMYFKAELRLRKDGYRAESTPQIISYLEKVVQINPDFAPAYAFLSVAYRQDDSTKAKALDAGIKATKLAPTVFAYYINVGNALMALKRDHDAQIWSERLNKNARTPAEKSMAEAFAVRLAKHEEDSAKKDSTASGEKQAAAEKQSPGEESGEEASTAPIPGKTATAAGGGSQTSTVEGVIREARCDGVKGVTLRFAILGETLSLAAADIAQIEFRKDGKASRADENPCVQWKDRKARLTYQSGPDAKSSGEIKGIDFF
jgi:tetratricopeptide (TPR) repeat protein